MYHPPCLAGNTLGRLGFQYNGSACPGESLPPDLIRGWTRFADKDTRQSINLEHVPIPQERDML